jgi:hypothetical protein
MLWRPQRPDAVGGGLQHGFRRDIADVQRHLARDDPGDVQQVLHDLGLQARVPPISIACAVLSPSSRPTASMRIQPSIAVSGVHCGRARPGTVLGAVDAWHPAGLAAPCAALGYAVHPLPSVMSVTISRPPSAGPPRP